MQLRSKATFAPSLARHAAAAAAAAVALLATLPAVGASLPEHAPLRILIVSDEVNPHGLSDGDLTQPGDLSAAFANPASGITLDAAPDALLEVPTDSLPTATAALSLPIDSDAAYDVLVYFAHRIPNTPGAVSEQAAFVAAVEQFLVDGGGVVSFHHGAYLTAGKEAMQEIIGASATGAVPWDTVDGQNVINVAPGHFITTHALAYPAGVEYQDASFGVALDLYPFFQNVPDERYPQFAQSPSAGDIQPLFASNYDQNGTQHILGFVHRRPAWQGRVVVYQPGEYQPAALDDTDGPNFQILVNAIYYAARRDASEVPTLGELPLVLLAGFFLLASAAMILRDAARRLPSSRR